MSAPPRAIAGASLPRTDQGRRELAGLDLFVFVIRRQPLIDFSEDGEQHEAREGVQKKVCQCC
jgi:hypothetical protein